ncbi:uncharacterized protein LOC102711702 [Oryza brachyantha]|uniref:uncharacterized protein LOC102711702 n=1 Tax=Oryza brachyantha TaxID=4533 RepID=UPI001AD986A3|nr:uncharacterized protein LOC102711702 [Oryza brachyantha]
MEERFPGPTEPQDRTVDVAGVLPAEAASVGVVMEADDDESDGEFEFEFPFVSRDSPAGTAALADDLFADGRIKPFYPVFARAGGGGGDHQLGKGVPPPVPPRTRGPLGRLFLEESRGSFDRWTSTSSSSAAASDEGGLEGAPPESYCLWTPGAGAVSASASATPRPPRKSSSTGSMARWRRISELVVGRSHSDGKEKFLFLPTPPHTRGHDDMDLFKPKPKPKPRPTPAAAGGKKLPAAAVAEIDTVAAMHRIAYGAKTCTATGAGGGTPRRTFLPYREELVGLFANVNGITRSHPHPF